MAKFLNTQQLIYWLDLLIKETERELIIIVPYIKTSEQIYTQLSEANKRGVETTLVYRENKLNDYEKQKLSALDNLNLMHHQNLHAKCYYNEKYLIIGSMNLYDYSERNNREMGILLHRESLTDDDGWGGNCDDEDLFKDAVLEIRNIINGSTIEKKSRETIEEGFEMNIIKTDKEKTEEFCKLLNKYFVHKKFEAVGTKNTYDAVCSNYSDRVNVTFEHRVAFNFEFNEEHLEILYNKFKPLYREYMFDGFKFYWNYYKSAAYLYKDSKHSFWTTNRNEEETYEKIKQGIDSFIKIIKPMTILK